MAETLNQQQVVELLRERQGKKTQREFAEQLGTDETALSAIYAMRRKPSQKILDYLKLRAKRGVTVYERIRK